jgi:hypothetical protein
MSGYGGQHQAVRRAVAPYVAGSSCVRCGRPILPGQAWHLDHTDDRAGYLGPSHEKCNTRAGGLLGAQRRRAAARAKGRVMDNFTGAVLGVECSPDRRHTAVVGAVAQGDVTMVGLLSYVDGVDAGYDAVLELRGRGQAAGVFLAQEGGAVRTLGRKLTAAGIEVTELTLADTKEAHDLFAGALEQGRLRVVADTRLTAAVQHAEARRVGQGDVLRRFGAQVDVSPALAAEWALFGVLAKPPVPFFGDWR